MSGFGLSHNDLVKVGSPVWVRKTFYRKDYWWPAVVTAKEDDQVDVSFDESKHDSSFQQDDVVLRMIKNRDLANLDVENKTYKASLRSASKGKECVASPRIGLRSLTRKQLNDNLPMTPVVSLKKVKTERKKLAKAVKVEQEEEDEGIDETGSTTGQKQDNWKDDFLDSISDDENEDTDKENAVCEDKENFEPAEGQINYVRPSKKRTILGELMKPAAKRRKIEPVDESEPLEVVMEEDEEEDEDDKPLASKPKSKPKPIVKAEKPKKEKLSEYEMVRLKNIQEQQQMLAALKAEMSKFKDSMRPAVAPKPRVYKKHRFVNLENRVEAPRTRSRKTSSGDYSENSSGYGSGESTPVKRERDYDSLEEAENWYYQQKKKNGVRSDAGVKRGKWCHDPNTDMIMPEDVTQAMLDNVITKFVSDKVYSHAGTTCHQCRQKTMDQKTICRSGHCSGVKGMFCGVCLKNRYGQDIVSALKDPNWMCPVCMDCCNCSICRNARGQGATGPITWLAQERGYTNVKDYLNSLIKRDPEDEDFIC